MVMLYVGVAVIAVGLIFMLFGLFVGWREAKKKGKLGKLNLVSDFVNSLKGLIRALADESFSTVLFTFGILLIFLGGVIAGAGGLIQ